jgi:hypothetical protein
MADEILQILRFPTINFFMGTIKNILYFNRLLKLIHKEAVVIFRACIRGKRVKEKKRRKSVFRVGREIYLLHQFD